MKSGFIFLKSAQMIDMFDSHALIGKISTFPTIYSTVRSRLFTYGGGSLVKICQIQVSIGTKGGWVFPTPYFTS